MKKSISSKLHSLVDYGISSLVFLAPKMFNLKGPARTLSYALSSGIASYGALSRRPATLSGLIPFKSTQKKALNKGNLAALMVVPLLTGAMKQSTARKLCVGIFLAGLARVLLTDNDKSEE